MVLNLIECDVLYDDLIDDYKSYGTMFERLFTGLTQAPLNVEYHSAIERRLPEPQPSHVYLITGSKFGAYEDEVWIHELSTWVRSAYESGAKLLGICFGHQIIAQALGGHVINSPKGWGVGIRQLMVSEQPYISDDVWLPKFLNLIYSHQDQVVDLPRDALTFLSDDFCPNGGFFIGKQVITLQGHPEFDAEYTKRLLGRRAQHIGLERYDAGMQSLKEKTDNALIGQYLLKWMQSD